MKRHTPDFPTNKIRLTQSYSLENGEFNYDGVMIQILVNQQQIRRPFIQQQSQRTVKFVSDGHNQGWDCLVNDWSIVGTSISLILFC